MKLKYFFTVLFVCCLGFMANAQTDTLRVHTSAQCSSCKKKIEHDMAYVKGVKSTNLDLKTKELIVVYSTEKTSPEKIRVAITKIGYDADSLPADKKAYDELSDCCKKGGHDH
jgi:mercuric ion binding protein